MGIAKKVGSKAKNGKGNVLRTRQGKRTRPRAKKEKGTAMSKSGQRAEAALKTQLEMRTKELATLQNQLNERTAEVIDLKTKLSRFQMDFDSYRARVNRDKEDHAFRKIGSTLENFLDVADAFDTAVRSMEGKVQDPQKMSEGFILMSKMLTEALEKAGIQEVPALNHPFDTNMHEAVGKVSDKNVPDSTIVCVERKGYEYNGRVIRPARVIVASNANKGG
jgi:molecular chaperone GrpE